MAERSPWAAEVADLVEQPLKEVQVDGLVLLSMMKHAKQSSPKQVTGSLLGLDQDGDLEVTNTFAMLDIGEDGDGSSVDDYQLEMMKMLREVNVDNNLVGWYQTAHLGNFCTPNVINTQYDFQALISNNTVVLVYDPIQTANGSLYLKAFRLTDEYMKTHKHSEGNFTKESVSINSLTSQNILEEIPVKLRNSGLIQAFLFEQTKKGLTEDCDFSRLDLSTNPFLSKNLEFLIAYIDELCMEQQKYQRFERDLQRQKQEQQRFITKRREENKHRRDNGEEPLPEEDLTNPVFQPLKQPSRLDGLLISHQIETYCNQVCNGYMPKKYCSAIVSCLLLLGLFSLWLFFASLFVSFLVVV
jgi:translation initiation factor 3 subunit H